MLEALFTGMTRTGEIVIQFPKASQILDKFRIDFCTGENRPIKEAIQENHLDEKEVLNKINQLYIDSLKKKNNTNLSSYSTQQLISYIVVTHHSYLYKTLPELSRYLAKILRTHRAKHPELQQVYNLYNDFKIEIEQHVINEEEVIFPMIQEFEQNPLTKNLKSLVNTFNTLEQEHLTNLEILGNIREVTMNYKIPADACLSYKLAFVKLQELEADLREHMRIENELLLPRIKLS